MYSKLNKRIYGVAVAIAFLVYLVGCLGFSVHADVIDNSIKLVCKADDVVLSGMNWSMYRVGSRTSETAYTLEGDFEEYPVSMRNLSTSDLIDTANTLENYAILDQIRPLSRGVTDGTGTLTFADLDVGLYLFSGKSIIIDNVKYIPSAFLLEVQETGDGSAETFDLVTYPKFRTIEITDDTSEYTIRKVWLNDENYPLDRPIEITCEIYKDGELEKTVVLGEKNNWEYTWTYKMGADWRVKEVDVARDYSVIYRENETQYLVLNSHDDYGGGTDRLHNNTNASIFSDGLITESSSGEDITRNDDTTKGTVSGTSFTYQTETDDVHRQSLTGDIQTDDYGNTVTTTDVENGSVTPSGSDSNSDSDFNVTSSPFDSTQTDESGNIITTEVTDTNTDTDTNTNTETNSDSNGGGNGGNNTSKTNASTTDSDIDKLPQTGQLWWPVPILAVVGLVSIAIGCQLKSKD